MQTLLKLAHLIDGLNARVGRAVTWLVLAVTILCAVNAIFLKAFAAQAGAVMGSNAMLELQWYLFSAVFLLGSGYALQRNAHVRIDILSGRTSRRTQAWIDIFGTVLFLTPMALVVIWLSSEVALDNFRSGEHSNSAGGLLLWPGRALIPLGFSLLWLQGVAEVFKRIAFLAGKGPDPLEQHRELSDEEKLAEDIRRARGLQEGDAQ